MRDEGGQKAAAEDGRGEGGHVNEYEDVVKAIDKLLKASDDELAESLKKRDAPIQGKRSNKLTIWKKL